MYLGGSPGNMAVGINKLGKNVGFTDYPAFHLSMDCFWCEVVSGDLVLKEAEAARWLTKDDIDSVPWLPADRTILDAIRSAMQPVKPLYTSEYDNEPLQRC